MPHFRVDDALHSHPKAQRAGDEAIGFWVRAGSYCMAYLTDGFVPEWWVKQQPKGTAKARKLIAAGLWDDGAEQDGEKGYQFHEFVGPGRQDSREKVEADRELARKRKQKSRRESQEESRQESQRDTLRDEQRPSRRTPGYTQPNPTHEKDFTGQLSESATDSNGRGSVAATPGAALVNELIPRSHPDAVRTQLRIRASELLRAGQPKADVAAALVLWLTKPSLGPNALPSLVSEAVKARTAPAGHTDKTRAFAELAAEERALEQAQFAAVRKELS